MAGSTCRRAAIAVWVAAAQVLVAGCRTPGPGESGGTTAAGLSDAALRNPSGAEPPYDIAFIWGGTTSRLCLVSRSATSPDVLAQDVVPGVPPAWSPDGKTIAFAGKTEGGGRKLQLIGTDGSDPRSCAPELAIGPAVSWSPDGKRLTAAGEKGDEAGIWTVSADATSADLVLPLDVARCLWVAWSPAGGRLAYLWAEPEEGVECELRVIGLDGGDGRTVNAGIPASATARPSWSPDGSRIAFTSAEGQEAVRVCVADIASGKARSVFSTLVTVPDPVWSPDGTRLCVEYAEGTKLFEQGMDQDDLSSVLASIEIYSIVVESGEKKAITDNRYSESDLAVSRDGEYIAAMALRGGGSKKQLRVVEVATGSSYAVVEADMPQGDEVPADVAEHGLLSSPRWRP